MAKFVLHGTIVAEPKRETLPSGLNVATIYIEEHYYIGNKDVVENFAVEYTGNNEKLVPTNRNLTGLTAICMGNIRGHEYKGRCYHELKGDTLTIIGREIRPHNEKDPYGVGSLESAIAKEFPEPAPAPVVESHNTESIQDIDDDLPF